MTAPKTADEIRQSFLDFFEQREHTIVPPSPVVPLDDPTLLFTNAGMNQFKDVFLGTGSRDYLRAADTQKCIRAGGKHNDLDDVGHDTYHHTFFEMLGSWSFGDYFKEDAIRWAWELLHGVYGIPAERLHATYFAGDEADGLPADEEAKQLWLDTTGIQPEHVHAFDKKDNFWEMADTGPCGPCTEIHVDLTPDLSGGPLVNADDPRVFEVWNLVFIQFNRDASSRLHTLPSKHVDTGMGFERLVTVLQGQKSNYDTDVFSPLMEAIRRQTGAPAYAATMPSGQPTDEHMRDITYRILADHLRCLSFAIADGALPDNEGRGYVLRRILRRAYRYGRQYMGADRPFLHLLVPALVDQMGGVFPELKSNQDRVTEAIHEEEESFARTLDTGLKLFQVAADSEAVRQSETIDGETAFKLHDTYGFPIDLTQIIAGERGLKVDKDGYDGLMEAAREKARSAGKTGETNAAQAILDAVAQLESSFFETTQTDDHPKFSTFETDSKVVGWVDAEGSFHQTDLPADQDVGVVLATTCFYAEQGGQVGDRGHIQTDSGSFEVIDTRRARDTVLHIGRMADGTLSSGDTAKAVVGEDRRQSIMSNHTATHLLNHALRDVLGDHVQQKGSLVDDEKTRFDFSHKKSLSSEQLQEIQVKVSRQIDQGLVVHDQEIPLPDAKSVHSLRAVFGEKYPDRVRVVSIGVPVSDLLANRDNTEWAGYSIELCGGTHTPDTKAVADFALVSEEAVAKGVRRIVGITGDSARQAQQNAEKLLRQANALTGDDAESLQQAVSELLEATSRDLLPITAKQEVTAKIQDVQQRIKSLQKAAAAERGAEALDAAAELLESATNVGDTKVIVGPMPDAPVDKLRESIDWLRHKSGSAAVLLFAPGSGSKVPMLAGLTKDLVSKGLDAKLILREAGKIVGGGGGGRPDMAQGGGKDASKVPEAVDHVREWLVGQLS